MSLVKVCPSHVLQRTHATCAMCVRFYCLSKRCNRWPRCVPQFTAEPSHMCGNTLLCDPSLALSELVAASSPNACARSGLQMVYKWSTSGLQVVYKWSTSGLQVVYKWSTRGLQAFYKFSFLKWFRSDLTSFSWSEQSSRGLGGLLRWTSWD